MSATRRVSKSTVDWIRFSQNIREADKGFLRAFKGKSDALVAAVERYPETLPQIDWAIYKQQVKQPNLVDKFQKAYAAVTVPYPEDVGNMAETLSKEEKVLNEQINTSRQKLNSHLETCRDFLDAMDRYLPEPNFTFDDFVEYFPDGNKFNPDEPHLYPGIPEEQPRSNPEFRNYGEGAVRKLL